MRVDFEKLNIPMTEIYAATVEGHRINVSRTHANMHPFVFEIAADDGFYTDIVAKGYGPDLEETMRRSVLKVREMAATASEPVTGPTVDDPNFHALRSVMDTIDLDFADSFEREI